MNHQYKIIHEGLRRINGNAYLGTSLMAFQNMKDILKGSKNIQINKLVIYKEMRIRMETDFSSAKLNVTVEKKKLF